MIFNEYTSPKNTNKEKTGCILGVSIVTKTEGNTDESLKEILGVDDLMPLPHLVFRPEGLLFNRFLKGPLSHMAKDIFYKQSFLFFKNASGMKEAHDFVWDYTVYPERRDSYHSFCKKNCSLNDILDDVCQERLETGTRHVATCVVPLILSERKVSFLNDPSNPDSNLQLVFTCKLEPHPSTKRNGETPRRCGAAMDKLDAQERGERIVTKAWEGFNYQLEGSEEVESVIEVKDRSTFVAERGSETILRDITNKDLRFHFFNPRDNQYEFGEFLGSKDDQRFILETPNGLIVRIKPEQRITFRTELLISKETHERLPAGDMELLNTFGSCLQEIFIQKMTEHNQDNKDMPCYMSHVRDCFSHELFSKTSTVKVPHGMAIRKDWYFDSSRSLPRHYKETNFLQNVNRKERFIHAGIVTFDNAYSPEELKWIENCCNKTLDMGKNGELLPETAQSDPAPRIGQSFTKTDRTKFFFNVRYLWRDFELKHPDYKVAAGIRSDVSAMQEWMKKPIQRMKFLSIIQDTKWINQVSLNDYSSGQLGLQPHFDDKERFARPITTLRLFSDSRMSFGLRYYGCNKGTMIIPLPRGRLAVLLKDTYASDMAKHAIRDCDLSHRSASLILRCVHPQKIEDARRYEREKKKVQEPGVDDVADESDFDLGEGESEELIARYVYETGEHNKEIEIIDEGEYKDSETETDSWQGQF